MNREKLVENLLPSLAPIVALVGLTGCARGGTAGVGGALVGPAVWAGAGLRPSKKSNRKW